MEYINVGRNEGATVHLGGERHGQEGYFIQPTIFTDCKPEMKIVQEEIFGPVAAIIKFKTEEGESHDNGCVNIYLLGHPTAIEVVEAANNTTYGLACSVFSENGSRALRVAHQLEAGTAWVSGIYQTVVDY
jgi:aldehyde dehydrogenase (NAD+)